MCGINCDRCGDEIAKSQRPAMMSFVQQTTCWRCNRAPATAAVA